MWGEVPQGLAYDGIILNLFFVSIAENQDCIGYDLGRVDLAGRPRRRGRLPISVLIILLALFAHSLLVEALGVHFVRHVNLVLLILIVGRAGIPPPIGIERASIPPGIAKATTPEAEAKAVTPKAIASKITVAETMEAIATKIPAPKIIIEAAEAEGLPGTHSRGKTRARAHSTGYATCAHMS